MTARLAQTPGVVAAARSLPSASALLAAAGPIFWGRRCPRRRRLPQLAQHPDARAAAERDAAGHQLRPGHVVRPRSDLDLVLRAAAEQLRDAVPDGAAAAQSHLRRLADQPHHHRRQLLYLERLRQRRGGRLRRPDQPEPRAGGRREERRRRQHLHGGRIRGRRHHLPPAPLHGRGRRPHHRRRDRPLGPADGLPDAHQRRGLHAEGRGDQQRRHQLDAPRPQHHACQPAPTASGWSPSIRPTPRS